VIGEFFYLSIPFIVAMSLPMAVLVAVLYSFSRLAAENEVTALRASGVSVIRIVGPVMVGGAVLALLMLLFNDQVLPRSNHKLRTLQTDIARKKPTFALREQVINEVIPGRIFLRAAHIDDATNRMREVFIYNFEDPTHRKTIYADSGLMGLTLDESTLQMTLHHGYVLQVPNDDPGSLQRLYFTTDVVRVRGVANKFEKTAKDDYRSEREMTVCQMDHEYQGGAYSLDVARHDLATALGNAARFAATGDVVTRNAQLEQKTERTSGQVYCGWITGVFGAIGRIGRHGEKPGKGEQQGKEGGIASSTPVKTQAEKPAEKQAEKPAAPTDAPAKVPIASRKVPVLAQHTGATAPSTAKTRAPAAPKTRPPVTPDAGQAATNIVRTTLGGLHPEIDGPRREQAAPQRRRYMPGSTVSPGEIDVIRSRITDAQITMSRYQVEIQKKFALAAACIVFVLFGAPLALRFPRGGVGLVIGVSIVAFALYYICLIGGQALAEKLILSPFWSMWAANVIFTVVGVIALVHSQRVGATTQGGDMAEMLENVRGWMARQVRRIGIPADRRRRTA
jgi:lipopolysaccharide export system permease protein